MDLCRKVTVSGGLPSEGHQPEHVLSPSCSKLDSMDDLFSGHSTEGDFSLEWLSIFVEDCLSSRGNYLPPAVVPKINLQDSTITPKPPKPMPQSQVDKHPLQKFTIPGKARSKRSRAPIAKPKIPFTSWSHHLNSHDQTTLQITSSEDPLLLQQAYWLADSELILPQKEEFSSREVRNHGKGEQERNKEMMVEDNRLVLEGGSISIGQPRRCSHCLSQRTPQWRAGPLGPKTLCNACGVRYKSGRLLPEYRPAKSPTFVSYKHSNSHKKVMEMRMTSSLLPSNSS